MGKKISIVFVSLFFVMSNGFTQNSTKIKGLYNDSSSLGFLLANNVNYNSIHYHNLPCKWQIFYVVFKVSKKGSVSNLLTSKGVHTFIQTQFDSSIKKYAGEWVSKNLSNRKMNKWIIQPVLWASFECKTDTAYSKKSVSGEWVEPSELEWAKSINRDLFQNLGGILESSRSIMTNSKKEFNYFDGYLLPFCIITADPKINREKE
jgi:hypothetical protein